MKRAVAAALALLISWSGSAGEREMSPTIQEVKARHAPRFLALPGVVSVGIGRDADGHEVVRYASPEDLIIKTPGFYEYVARTRIQKKLGSADRYAEAHFDGPSLYQSEIDRNMDFLRETIETADFTRLRRTCYSLSAAARRAA